VCVFVSCFVFSLSLFYFCYFVCESVCLFVSVSFFKGQSASSFVCLWASSVCLNLFVSESVCLFVKLFVCF